MKKYLKLEGNDIDIILDKFVDAIPEKGWVPKFVYNITLRNRDEVVGKCEARIGIQDNLFYNGHIGYSVIEEYRGRGFAVQATKLLFKVLKDNNITKVYISNDPSNISSKRVCEKLNMKYLGVFDLPDDNEMRVVQGKTQVNVFEIDL